jgi:divalent metal cation (Fe/Co/Zn/Cd) transporter
MGKKQGASLPGRQPILDALADSPDVESVVRLSVVSDSDGHWVIAATLHIIDSLPVYALAAVLDDAKRRVRGVVGDTAEVYIEPEMVKDPSREDPPTDVIVIKASD